MPEGSVTLATRDDDPYAWALSVAEQLRRRASLKAGDRAELSDFLEEWADEMLATVRSQIVNLLAHATKVAHTRNPDVIGHWRSECVEFHDRLLDSYRPSMRDKIDITALWRRAQRKVIASFRDNNEPLPTLPTDCAISVDDLIDPELDLDRIVAAIAGK